MDLVILILIIALLIPMYEGWRDDNVWQKMLALASVSTKTAIIFLCISVVRDDWMMGVVGVITLSVGNAGYMLLAHLLKRLNTGSEQVKG
jgi:multicomponent Na+:H+ antiporter subunit F